MSQRKMQVTLFSKYFRLRKRGSPTGQCKAKGQECENGGGPALTTLVTCPPPPRAPPCPLQQWCGLLCLISSSKAKREGLGKFGTFPDLLPGLRQKHMTSDHRLIPQVSIVLKVKLHGTLTLEPSHSVLLLPPIKKYFYTYFFVMLKVGKSNDICL